jgi:hypothetical protein
MSLGLIKPGMRSANLTGKRHPHTGELLVPLGYLKNGTAVWPVLGASEDDDPDNVPGEEDDEDDVEDDEEDEDDPKSSKTRKSKTDEDEDDEDDDPKFKASRQAKRYRLALREEQRKTKELNDRLKAIEDRDKNPDEVVSRDLSEARSKVDALTEVNRVMTAQLAFFKTPVPGIVWVDASDAFALAEREGLFDDVIDEDGTVDTRELRRGLKDLAKRKQHLVKNEEDPKSRARKASDEDDEDDDDEEPRSRRSGAPMNTKRRGAPKTPDRAALAKKFPVLGRM